MKDKKDERLAHVYFVRLENRKELTGKDISAIGEKLLDYAIRHLYGLTIEDCQKSRAEHGKPCFLLHPEIEFNLSHSGDYVILAVSGIPVGIDIQEKKVTDIDKLGKKVFSPEAYRAFLTHEDRQEEFFREWVLKESYVKWTGEGLLHGLMNLPMTGWHQFLYIDKNYFCAIRAEYPLEIRLEELKREDLK